MKHFSVLFSILVSMSVVATSVAQDKEEPKPPVNNNPRLPSGWRVNDLERPQPKLVAPAESVTAPPADAIVLFDGTDLSAWAGSKKHTATEQHPNGKPSWRIEDGYMEIVLGTGGLSSRQKFGDMQLHLEFATPTPPTEEAQRRGNSGVFLMGRYEIQIMDGHENTAYADGMTGAVYGQTPPLVNVCKKPGEWQSFDIFFTAPVFKDGKISKPARVTVLQNGVLVQLNTEILGPTKHKETKPYVVHGERSPIGLQNHGQKVRFRNIWVRDLQD
jgi:hypothetical protein